MQPMMLALIAFGVVVFGAAGGKRSSSRYGSSATGASRPSLGSDLQALQKASAPAAAFFRGGPAP
jgi:hypothetical protein